MDNKKEIGKIMEKDKENKSVSDIEKLGKIIINRKID